jgi:hypothetical protein
LKIVLKEKTPSRTSGDIVKSCVSEVGASSVNSR